MGMNRVIPALLAIALLATPAHATGGFVCRTAGDNVIEVTLGFGHVPGSPLIAARLADSGRNVPVSPAQWWFDDKELRVILIGEDAMAEEVRVRAARSGQVYDGSLWREGKRRWVRCREG
jgi:hypothetical protein